MAAHVAVLHAKWLARFKSGQKRAELRIAKRPPIACKAQPGDVVHLREPREAPSWAMDVTKVIDLGFCDRNQLRAVRRKYGRDLALGDEALPYIDDAPGGFAVLVYLSHGRASSETRAPRYQPWAILKD